MRQRRGAKHFGFQIGNHPFTGTDFGDNSGFERRAINTDFDLIDHLPRQFLHRTGSNMLRKESVLIIAGAGNHVDAGIAHQIQDKGRVAPHITVSHLNNIAHAEVH